MESKNCPICKNNYKEEYIPFLSKGCYQIDLNRWLGEKYHISVKEEDGGNN